MTSPAVYSYLPSVPGHEGYVLCEQALCIPLPRSYFRDGPTVFGTPLNMPDNRAELATQLMQLVVDCAKEIECEHVYAEMVCNSDLFYANTDNTSVRQSSVELYRVWILLGVGQVFQISKALRTRLNCDNAIDENTPKRRKLLLHPEPLGMTKLQYLSALRTFDPARKTSDPLTFDVVETAVEDGGEGGDFEFNMMAAASSADQPEPPHVTSTNVSFDPTHALAAFVPRYTSTDERRMQNIVVHQQNPLQYLVAGGIQFPQPLLSEALISRLPCGDQLLRTTLPEFVMPIPRLQRHIVTTERLLGGIIDPPANRRELEKLCTEMYGDPADSGGLAFEMPRLNLANVGERLSGTLFSDMYTIREHIQSWHKLRETLGDKFVDSLITRRVESLFSTVYNTGVVETYAQVRQEMSSIMDDMEGNSMYHNLMYGTNDAIRIGQTYGAKYVTRCVLADVTRAQVIHDTCNLTRTQTFCSLFMYKCLGRLGAHRFGAQILVALLGGVGIGKSVILEYLEMMVPCCLMTSSASASSSALACMKTEMNKVCVSDDAKTDGASEHNFRSITSQSFVRHSRQVKQANGKWETEDLVYPRIIANFFASNETFTPQIYSRMLGLMFLDRTGEVGKTTADLVSVPLNEARVKVVMSYMKVSIGYTYRFWEYEAVGALRASYTLYFLYLQVLRYLFIKEYGEQSWKRKWFPPRIIRHMKDNAIAAMARRVSAAAFTLLREAEPEKRLRYFQSASYITYEDLASTSAEIEKACCTTSEENDLMAAFAKAVMFNIGDLTPMEPREGYYQTSIRDNVPGDAERCLQPLLKGSLNGQGLIGQFLDRLRVEPHHTGDPVLVNSTESSKNILVNKHAILEAETDTERKVMYAVAEYYMRAFRPAEGVPPMRKAWISYCESYFVLDADLRYALLHPNEPEQSWGNTPTCMRAVTKSAAHKTLALMALRPSKDLILRGDNNSPSLTIDVAHCHDSAVLPTVPHGAVPVDPTGVLGNAKSNSMTLHKTQFSVSQALAVSWSKLEPYIDRLRSGSTGPIRTTPSSHIMEKGVRLLAAACGVEPGTAIYMGNTYGPEKHIANVIVHEETEFDITMESPLRKGEYNDETSLYQDTDEIITRTLEVDGRLRLTHESNLEERIANHVAKRHRIALDDEFSYSNRRNNERITVFN